MNLKNLTIQELIHEFETLEEPKFRAKQLYSWLFAKGIDNFDQMTNLSKDLRAKLSGKYDISYPKIKKHLISQIDKTEKFLFELHDTNTIETVIIPSFGRKTICLSTQVGCRFGCQFCASGKHGFTRNLTVAEILDQILILKHKFKHEITNYVFMGIGEPLDNFKNLDKALAIMNDKDALNIGARKITISTSGHIPGIEKLIGLGMQVNLSLSLHASHDHLRSKIMPINKKYPLDKLLKVCEKYVKATNRIITLEYVLIKDVNDSKMDVEKLIYITKRLKAKVNVIPLNASGKLKNNAPTPKDMQFFLTRLSERGIKATARLSKGSDILAACGQLRNS